MNLENVTAELRPRGEWEAADFGARLIRRDAVAIYRVWFRITLPLLILALLMAAFGPFPGLALIIYWWLEPVADGPILRIISRRLFGEDADVRGAIRAAPALARRNWIFLLPPYRFHFARSIAMPVTQLEGLAGKARRQRAKTLNAKILNYGTGVTIAYQHLATALYFGVVLIGFTLVPPVYQDTLGDGWIDLFWAQDSRVTNVLGLLAFYFAQSALQPWFVGAGFGLYVNCRTQLEAWDIEVAFRRMAQRRAAGLAAAVLLAVLAVPAALPPEAALAQETTEQHAAANEDPGFPGYWNDDEVRPAVEAILESDALSTTREIERWQSIDRHESADGDGTSTWWLDLVRGLGRILSLIAEGALWIGVAGLCLLLFLTRRHWLPYLGWEPAARPVTRRVVLSGDVLSRESLPEDIPAEVARLWNAGQRRQALSLMYRGSVFAAVTRHGVRLPESATEGMCVAAVGRQTGDTHAAYFRRIVDVWIHCAYGSRQPAADEVMSLCREWPRHYESAT